MASSLPQSEMVRRHGLEIVLKWLTEQPARHPRIDDDETDLVNGARMVIRLWTAFRNEPANDRQVSRTARAL